MNPQTAAKKYVYELPDRKFHQMPDISKKIALRAGKGRYSFHKPVKYYVNTHLFVASCPIFVSSFYELLQNYLSWTSPLSASSPPFSP
jgi:hypothetical protein